MEPILENRYVLYTVIFICFINLVADVATQEFFFAFLFLIIIFVMDSFIDNKTVSLSVSFVLVNILMLKFKFNQMKYYYNYLQSSPQKNQVPSYVTWACFQTQTVWREQTRTRHIFEKGEPQFPQK